MIKRLAVNTGSNLGTLFVNMAITFIMAPIYVRMLGQYDYGLREMVMAMIGYMGMLSLGMQPTISRFASMHNAQKDRDSLLVVYASSLVFMSLVGLLLAGFFWIWAVSYPELIMPEEGGSETKYSLFLLIIGTNLFFAFPKIVTESYLEGLQRYYLKNAVNLIGSVLLATIAYIYMTPGNGLLLLVGLVALSGLIKLFIFGGLLLRPACGAIYPNMRYFSWEKLTEMLHFGFKSFIQGAALKIETASDRLIIGGVIGPAMIPLYSIPANLVNYLMSISQTLTHAFMPLFSDLSAREQTNQIKRIYMLASKLVVGFIMPAGVGAVAIGAPFIDVWMPGQFDQKQVDGIVLMLVLYVVIPKLNPFASRYLTAIGQHAIFAKVAPVAALANLVVSIFLVFKYGVIGAAMGSVLPVFVVTPIFLKYSCRALGVSSREYVSNSILPTLVPTLIMGVVIFWIRNKWGLDSYSEILSCIGVGAALYAIVFWMLAFNSSERKFLLNLVRTKFR